MYNGAKGVLFAMLDFVVSTEDPLKQTLKSVYERGSTTTSPRATKGSSTLVLAPANVVIVIVASSASNVPL